MMPLAQKNNMPCFQTWKKKENIHRNSNGFGVFARAYVRNSIGRNAQMYFLRKSSKGVVPFSREIATISGSLAPPKFSALNENNSSWSTKSWVEIVDSFPNISYRFPINFH